MDKLLTATAAPDAPEGWPAPMRVEAFHGLPGAFVTMVEPHTEADPHGLLVQFLSAAGNAIGRGPGLIQDGAFHATVVCPVLVGVSSKARKGTSWSRTRETFELADPEWTATRIEGGLSTSEGLVYHVRDEQWERRKARKGETGDEEGMVNALVDAGVSDKRLMVVETEFAQIFKVLQREGNTLSMALRTLWDHGYGGALTKRDHTRVTKGHVSVIGHCTVDEFRAVVSDVDVANGLINRFVFCCVRRTKLLSRGGFVRRELLEEFAAKLARALREASGLHGALDYSEEAYELWDDVYPDLTADRPGRFGQATSRAEAQVTRLALIYAVLDGRTVIDTEHLEAALAVWEYATASAAYVFGGSTGDPVADKILAALRGSADGMTRGEIRARVVGGKLPEERIEVALALLARHELARKGMDTDTGGRPAERWRATTRGEEQ